MKELNFSSLLSLCRGGPAKGFKITDNSREVKKGDIFTAVKGQKGDGHFFIDSAVKNGAEVLVVEDKQKIPYGFKGAVFQTNSTRKALSILLNHYYDFTSEKMFCVGVTGTNGKTTVSYMIEKIFSDSGWKTGVIGTTGQRLESFRRPPGLTTPGAVELAQSLHEFYKRSARAVVMEVSSIGLDQRRVDDICFNLAVFTNITRDHLDYHQTMENYFKSKRRFFEVVRASREKNFLAVLNADDAYFDDLKKACRMPFVSYGLKGKDFSFRMRKENLKFIEFEILFQGKTYPARLPMIGVCNALNALAALASAVSAGFSLEKGIRALEEFKGVPGRLQKLSSEPFVFVDYAHTPSALTAVLTALKRVKNKDQKLIIVFGCGGERDKGKRGLMGKTAVQFCDYAVVTSDNPRNENPAHIIQDILKGSGRGGNIFSEENRKEGIKKALALASAKDIVLIAGRGHEPYQIIGDQKVLFNDAEEAKKLLAP